MSLNWDKIKKATEITILISGAVFAFWRFVYEDYILPRSYPPSLSVEATLAKVGELDSMRFVKLQIKIANHSKSFINILNSTYQISGKVYERGDLRKEMGMEFVFDYKDLKWDTATIEGTGNDRFIDTEHTDSETVGINCGTFFSHNYLEPGDEDDRSYLIPVNKKYMTAYLHYQIFYTKKNISAIKQLEMTNENCEYFWLNKSGQKKAQEFNLDKAIDEHNRIIDEYQIKVETREVEVLLIDSTPSIKEKM